LRQLTRPSRQGRATRAPVGNVKQNPNHMGVKMKSVILVVFVLMVSSSVNAKDAIIESGFKAFKSGGSVAAWPAFAKGGPMDGSKELIAQASQFGQIEAYYGSYVGHEYVSEKILSESNKIVYVVLNMDNGPLYGIFQLYKKADGSWIAPTFNFHTNVQQVWPANLYSTCSQ